MIYYKKHIQLRNLVKGKENGCQIIIWVTIVALLNDNLKNI